MSPTLLEGLLFLLLAALLAAYSGTLIFAWRARRRATPAAAQPPALPAAGLDAAATLPAEPAESEHHHVR
jgi:hypothetical protein